ncbi:hypothetical protein TRFO_20699 [Tritrichomonas foetus]|uniref:Uncharacterized protein n=1 Tax=Tritrichomonas foetus TaxID=1144522 RepID=A0A1J4KFB5_9EUKA|nr:hypothetical protein TRFO_20699 [Tritrichomonas foetus]|eukprot:OHT10145.1 hypothetical protein TRFO_20699 [Tritrichomonas foetus]
MKSKRRKRRRRCNSLNNRNINSKMEIRNFNHSLQHQNEQDFNNQIEIDSKYREDETFDLSDQRQIINSFDDRVFYDRNNLLNGSSNVILRRNTDVNGRFIRRSRKMIEQKRRLKPQMSQPMIKLQNIWPTYRVT